MRTGLLLLVVLLIAVPAAAQGIIQGRVTDKTGAEIPGVEVTVTGPELRRTAVTDKNGDYRLSDLPAGSYSVRTALAGFCPATRENVRVPPGETLKVDFALSIAGLGDVLWVAMDAPWYFQHADLVVHLHIEGSRGSRNWEESDCATTTTEEYEASVMQVVKAHSKLEADAKEVSFLQGHMNQGEPRYRKGDEFVAFLSWHPAAGAFVRSYGPPGMFLVRDGRVDVRWGRGGRQSVTVEDFLAELRALAKEQR